MFRLIEISKFPNTSNLFYVNWKGELFTKNFLDFETSKEYRFQIRLLNNCNSSQNVLAKANVIVQIADVNDNSPIFKNELNETRKIQIYENMRRDTILYR